MKMYEDYITYPSIWNKSIPSHWDVLPMYAVATKKSICNCVDLPLLSVYLDVGVIPFSAKAEKRTNVTSKDLSKYQRVDSGDFVLNNQQAWRGSVGVSFYTGIVSPAYIVLSMNDLLNSKYANYLFRTRIMVDQYLINSTSVGSIQRNIYWPALKRTRVIVPPREEQDQIVRFLDWKVSEINKLLNIKKHEVDELEELKKSIVTKIVTRGLINEPLRKSDIYWLKKVPVNWTETKLKHILQKQRRDVQKNADLLICSNSGEVRIRGDEKIGLVASDDTIYQGVKKGDLLIHGMDTWHGAIGISDYDGMCTPVVHVCTCTQSKRFVAYYLKMMAYTKVFKAISNGVRQNTSDFRSWDKVGNLFIALPSLEEQEAIADQIDTGLSYIAQAKEKISQEILLLEELKTKLISDVITGNIDVRDVEIPEYEFVDEDVESDSEAENDLDNIEEQED